MCIQGAPGTGKTAVGLHRAAWLLFTYRARLARTGVLVIGPNRVFLEHISAVLPALGEVDVRHTTIEDLVGAGVEIRGHDEPEVAMLKGDARFAGALRRAVWGERAPARDVLEVKRGHRVWRVPAPDIAEAMAELASRGLSYEAARQLVPSHLARLVAMGMQQAGEYCDDRARGAIVRSAPVKAYAKTLWPPVRPDVLLHRLLADPAALAQAAAGDLTPREQARLAWSKAPRTPTAARWSAADAVLLDELRHLLGGADSVGHVILDEAQDLSPMQLRAVGRRAARGALTVLGDLAQGTTPWATASWEETLTHLGKPDGVVEELTRGFRVPARVLEFASRLLPHIAPGLTPPEPVRANTGRLDLRATAPATLAESTRAAVTDALRTPGTVGVIVSDAAAERTAADLAEAGIAHRVEVVEARVAKGLEFDSVVVVDPAAIAAAEPDERTGLRRLYVVFTRAVAQLIVIHLGDLPEPVRVTA